MTTTATSSQTETAMAPRGRSAGLVSSDDGQFANLLDTTKFEHMWRVAALFAKSGLVPQHYQNQPENCFIATQMAVRLGVDPFMFMQNTYIVHGRPGMEAKLAIALINSSGLFVDSLDYDIDGQEPTEAGYRVRAVATRKTTGKVVEGPWIDWRIVRAEKWDSKEGSKWRTMPGLMFQYRAATWFGRLHCPERLMGMQTQEEIEDVGRIHVDNTADSGAANLTRKIEQAATEEREATPPVVLDQKPVVDKPASAPTTAANPPATETKQEPAADPAPAGNDNPGPSRHEQVAILLAETCGVTLDAATAKLERLAKTLFRGKSYTALDAKTLDNIAEQIKRGDITVPK